MCASGSPCMLWGATMCFGVLLHAMRSFVFFGAAPPALGSPKGIMTSPVCFAILLYTSGSPVCSEFPPWRHPDPPLGAPLVSSQGQHLRFTGYHRHQSPSVPQCPTLLPACRDVRGRGGSAWATEIACCQQPDVCGVPHPDAFSVLHTLHRHPPLILQPLFRHRH